MFLLIDSLLGARAPGFWVRHRLGCVCSLLIKNLIVRSGENLLTELRMPAQLWRSPRQPPLWERVEDS
jgi:hypothetical protein